MANKKQKRSVSTNVTPVEKATAARAHGRSGVAEFNPDYSYVKSDLKAHRHPGRVFLYDPGCSFVLLAVIILPGGTPGLTKLKFTKGECHVPYVCAGSG